MSTDTPPYRYVCLFFSLADLFLKGCPGWGANPGSFVFVYFLIPPLYRCHSGSPSLADLVGFFNFLFHDPQSQKVLSKISSRGDRVTRWVWVKSPKM
jgi:hypothetical protein